MVFKNVRNLLLINHNDGFIDDDEFVLLYNLFASKNLDFPYDSYATDLNELDESESFAEFRFRKRDIRTLKEVLQIPDMITCNQRAVCDRLEGPCMLLKRLSFPCRYGFELVLARQPWFRIPLKEKSFVKLLTSAGPQIIQETNITAEGGDGSLSACKSLVIHLRFHQNENLLKFSRRRRLDDVLTKSHMRRTLARENLTSARRRRAISL